MSCSLCNIDESYKKSFGCEQPLDEPVWEHLGDVYYSCPLLFIPPEVVEWYMEYDYYINVQGADMNDLPWTWMYAYSNYRAALNDCERMKAADRMNKHNSNMAFMSAKSRGNDG